MNIALIGYGKMGKTIERLALEEGHRVAAIVDPFAPEAEEGGGKTTGKIPLYRSIADARSLSEADAALEFTGPGTAADNIKALAERRIPTVAGSTGWYEHLDEVKAAVEAAHSSLVWASNYSLGTNLLYRIAAYAAELVDKFPEYDAGGYEFHHNQKADSPSGTAKTLVDILLSKLGRKKKVVWDTLKGRVLPEELHFPSLRLGSVPGTHAVIFDSPEDTLELIHRARNRDGLARGALRAAQWLSAEKRRGVFTIEDVLTDILG
jgi:4-hydroxy-tetrahydrodipicolinate reductase